jgi:hypothetical protein
LLGNQIVRLQVEGPRPHCYLVSDLHQAQGDAPAVSIMLDAPVQYEPCVKEAADRCQVASGIGCSTGAGG